MSLSKNPLFFCATVLFGSVFISNVALADKYTFGGYAERQKGKGDHRPPECVVNTPSAASSDFSITWDCNDNYTPKEDIRSELWIFRNSSTDIVGRRIETFLGFPAAGFIDATQLGVANFTDGLPARFRVLAIDNAGNMTVSPFMSVGTRGNSLSACDLEVITEATEASGGATGEPSKTSSVSNGAVDSTQINSSTITISTPEEVAASPCEISSVCDKDNEFKFEANVSIKDDSSVTATFSIPEEFTTTLTGTATLDGVFVTRIDLTGTTAINGVPATVTLSCVD